MTNQNSKICQNCKNEFVIEPEDFKFYEKIKVPPPTWCPECRFMRRMAWRNAWRLFRKIDAHSGEEIFSLFSPTSYVNIYENNYWFSDAWDPMTYGQAYDWESPFFVQISELLRKVPLPARPVIGLINSDFSINANYLKNCYLVAASGYTEDSAYMVWDYRSKNSFDSYLTESCELCYGGVNLTKCYKTFFSVDCEECQDVIFSKDCIGCSYCFGCVSLRNKSYHIFNKSYTRDEYFKTIADLDIGSNSKLGQAVEKTYLFWKNKPQKFMHGRHNLDVSGDYIYNSKHAKYCHLVHKVEDSKYCQNILEPARDCFDYSNWGQSELIYDSLLCGERTYNVKFSWNAYSSNTNLQYCIFCHNSSDLFGCVGLRNKRYCILNKQYSKEEYEKLIPKIIEHMDKMPYTDKLGNIYKYGEFFPPELSPSEYNVTEAQEYFPLTKEEAIEKGYSWKDPEPRNYQIQIPNAELPDHIKDAKDDIVGQVIECAHQKAPPSALTGGGGCNEQCTEAYKIIPQELTFLRRMNLPLPRLCPNCRHYQRIRQRNPLKLWHRKCQCAGAKSENGIYPNTGDHIHHKKDEHCPNEFETTYAPERPEIVYCENCYLREVV